MGYVREMASHRDDARRIYEHATEAKAGRVALRNDGQFAFAGIDENEIATAISELSPQHYKLQNRENGRWVDMARLRPVSAPAPGLATVRASITEASALSTTELAQLANGEPGEFARALRGLSQRLNDQLARDLSVKHTRPALELLERLATVHDSPHARYFHANVALFDALAGHLDGDRIDEADTNALDEAIRARTAAQPELFSTDVSDLAVANALGKVHSLTDRDAAASYFETVRRDDTHGLIEHFYADMGARTYFRDPGEASDGLTQQILESIVPLDAGAPGAKTGIVVSVDPKFYRVYAPIMFQYAQQLPEVDYNILICGPADAAEAALADGATYRDALARLNRSGAPANVHHFNVPIPEAVKEAKTFYASARFFAVQAMLERYSHLYLMDADLTTNTDPRPFLKRVSRVPFAAVRTRGMPALSPWRRYMAGNVPVSREVLDTRIIDDLQDYLAAGLGMRGSWMLDQNALAYVFERSPDRCVDLDQFKRPFFGPRFRTVWEKNYRG